MWGRIFKRDSFRIPANKSHARLPLCPPPIPVFLQPEHTSVCGILGEGPGVVLITSRLEPNSICLTSRVFFKLRTPLSPGRPSGSTLYCTVCRADSDKRDTCSCNWVGFSLQVYSAAVVPGCYGITASCCQWNNRLQCTK